MKTIHAVNAVPWQPGEQTEIHTQTDRQTDRPTTITRWPRRDLGLITIEVLIHEKKLTMAKITVEGFLADDGGEV